MGVLRPRPGRDHDYDHDDGDETVTCDDAGADHDGAGADDAGGHDGTGDHGRSPARADYRSRDNRRSSAPAADHRAGDNHGRRPRTTVDVLRWNPALRAYTFQLPGKFRADRTYVLDVRFETIGGANKPGGGRLFDRLVIEPPADIKKPDKEVKRGGLIRPGH